MTTNDSIPPSQSPSENQEIDSSPAEQASWDLMTDATGWQKARWLAARAVALLGTLLLMGVTAVGFAGWYTSRPQFCRSCHIMEPYYVSWQHSSHKDVSCIKCHFPPGVAEKVRGKLLGLVQLAKYVTQSAGPRPAAEIPDASCLRSGCHETRMLSGRIEFQGIPFDHGPHLDELRRGKKLRCTSCHSQIVQGAHMKVTTTTCFLCHFKGEYFNEGLGACTRCHQIPENDFDLGGNVPFNHNLAYERGVDCAKCHGDLVRGKGEVPSERCGVCHNRQDDLARIDDHQFVHQVHVTDHKVDCLSCHLAIEHSLDEQRIAHAAADCASCHPNHHQEQVNMLEGTGARTIPAHPSSMTVARIACLSCHRTREISATGTVVWKASTESCLDCHEPEVASRLESYSNALSASHTDIEATIGRIRDALGAAELPTDRATEMSLKLDDLQIDLSFLHVGNGAHNIHYADTLTRALVEQLTFLCDELQIEKPEITLPEPTTPETDQEAGGETPDTLPEQADPQALEPVTESGPLEEDLVEPNPPDETQ